VSDGRARLVCLALTIGALAALAVITDPIAFGDGLGFDGRLYATMVNDLRTGRHDPVSSLAAYRVLAPAVVAMSGLEPRSGFLLLDIVAAVITAQALFAILRHSGATAERALLGVAWWLALPMGPRAYLHYPVLTEALALALMTLLALAALRRATIAFALLLALAVVARENLLVMLPFLFFSTARDGVGRAALRTALAGVPAIAALSVVRWIAPVTADPIISLPGAALLNTFLIVLNIDEHAWRALFAVLFTFGALPAVVVGLAPRALALLRREPAWIYLAVATAATAIVGGIDHDRYAAPIALPLIAVVFGGHPGPFGRGLALPLTAIHVALCVLPFPAGASEAAFLARAFGTMEVGRLAPIAGIVLAGLIATWLLVRTRRFGSL
jgi:hypothetical protein